MSGWEVLGMKTRQHLPLFREVQAALEVLALPTGKVQQITAKPSQASTPGLEPGKPAQPLKVSSLSTTSLDQSSVFDQHDKHQYSVMKAKQH